MANQPWFTFIHKALSKQKASGNVTGLLIVASLRRAASMLTRRENGSPCVASVLGKLLVTVCGPNVSNQSVCQQDTCFYASQGQYIFV